jgi:hypothetical protein
VDAKSLISYFSFQTVRFYEIDDGGGHKTEAKAKFDHRAAVLACSFSADATHAFSGGLDTVVKELRVDVFFFFNCSKYLTTNVLFIISPDWT